MIKDYEDIPEIECRPKELNQVFMTLLTNAFQAMDGEGELRLRVSSRNDQAVVEISDNGKGIPPEKLESLFDIGFGAKQARMSMGLGLPTAKNTVDGHGGELSVESELGKGTTVRITLPIQNH